MVCKYSVLAHYRYYVRSDAYGAQIQQGYEFGEGDAVVLGKGLYELETHSASRQVTIWVCGICAFGVQYCHCRRQLVIRHMMVADDEVYAFVLGVLDFVYCLYAAVQYDDKFHPRFLGKVYALTRDTISFLIPVRDVVVYVGGILFQELVNKCHGSNSVHVIVAVDQDSLLSSQSVVQALYGHCHVAEEEGIEKFCQLGSEEFPCLV